MSDDNRAEWIKRKLSELEERVREIREECTPAIVEDLADDARDLFDDARDIIGDFLP